MIQQTSLTSYDKLTLDKCKNVWDRIKSILQQYPGGLTDREICSKFSWEENQNLQPKARRNELAFGKFDCTGKCVITPHQVITRSKRKCTITNRTVCVWEVNNHMN